MKKKCINFIIILCIFIIVIFMFKNTNLIKKDVLECINLWLTKIIPTLFPMIIINDILINCGLPEIFNKFISNFFNKTFNLSGNGTYVLIMSMISGTPANAYILKEMYENNYIYLDEANKLIYYCYFSNPLFLFTMLSFIFKSKYIIIIIIISHYIANLIIGLLIKKDPITYISKYNNKNHFNLTTTIKKGTDTMIMVLGTIIIYSLIGLIITNLLNIKSINIITGFLEITKGLNILTNISINNYIKIILSISIISFGGLSIHSQIKSILNDTSINYKNFFVGRLFHVIISIIIVSILYMFHIS